MARIHQARILGLLALLCTGSRLPAQSDPLDRYLRQGLERNPTLRQQALASRFDFVVPRAPTRAGIDPYNLLIDRNPGDNTKEIR